MSPNAGAQRRAALEPASSDARGRVARHAWTTARDPRLGLTVIVAIGLALRLSEIGGRDLWEDEAYSVQVSKGGVLDIVDQSISDTHPPLYYLFLHYWMELFGDSELAVRMPSVVFGVATVVLVYAIGRMLAGVKAALFAALLVALSTFHLNYSIEARMYSMLAFLATASFYFFILGRQAPSRRTWIGYVVTTGALLYTHVYGIFVVVAQNLFVLARIAFAGQRGRRWTSEVRTWIGLQLALAAVFLPWAVVVIGQVATELEGGATAKLDPETYPEPSGRRLIDTFRFFAGGSAGLALLVLLCVLGLAALALVPARGERARVQPDRRQPPEAPVLLLSLWLATSILVPFVFSRLVTPIYNVRQTIAASIAFFLLAAVVLARARGRAYFAASVCLIALSSVYYLYRYVPFNVQSWQTLSNIVDERADPGDLVVFDSVTTRDAFSYYSSREQSFREFVASRATDPRMRALAQAADEYPRAWLVSKPDFAIGTALRRELERSYDERYRLGPGPPLAGLELTLFRPASARSP